MRPVTLLPLLLVLARDAGADAPVSEPVRLAPIKATTPCKGCKRIAELAVESLGDAYVFEQPLDHDHIHDHIAAIWLVLDDGHTRSAGKIAEWDSRSAAVRVTPRLHRFQYPTGSGSAPTVQTDVALDLAVHRGGGVAIDGADTQKVFVVCGPDAPPQSPWSCKRVVVDLASERGCITADWNARSAEPSLMLTCSTSLASIPRD